MSQSKIKKTLTHKIRIYMVLVGLSAIVIYFILSTLLYISSYARIEGNDLEQDSRRAVEMIQSKALDLQRIAKDYGLWDEASERLKKEDVKWFQENFSGWIPKQQDVELVVVATKKGKIIDQSGVDVQTLAEVMQQPVVQHALKGAYNQSQVFPYGLMYLKNQYYLVAVSPIIKMDRSGTNEGVVLLGKPFDQKQLLSIRISSHNEFALVRKGKIEVATVKDEALKATMVKIASPDSKQGEMVVFNNKSYRSNLLQDVLGQPLGRLVITTDDSTYHAMLLNMNFAGIAVVTGIALVIFILSGSLAYSITKPLEQLRKQMNDMSQSATLGKVAVKGTVEIQAIADAFNEMSDNFHKMVLENEQYKNNKTMDGLTGLHNQRYLYQYLGKHLQNYSKPFHILLVDVDYFKKVNKQFGHQNGDRVLQRIAEIIRGNLDEKSMACRYAGEEFIVVVHSEDSASCFNVAENIRQQVYSSEAIRSLCANIPVSVSIGLAAYPENAMDIATLLDKVDKAMGMAKANGRNTSWLYATGDTPPPEVQEIKGVHRDALMEALMQLVVAVDNKENYYTRHSEKVAIYAEQIGNHLLKTERERYALYMAAMLHDCGKITVPESIIEKADVLTLEEFQVVRMHPEMGCNLIQYSVDAPEILEGVRHHHERWDGTGYPDALAGEEIPLFARIISIADAYQSITSDRPYRAAKSVAEAIEEMKVSSGKQFDPEILEIFIKIIHQEIQIGPSVTRM